MGNFSIKDLAVLSGIKAHTLRIWEQRYQILKPQRTDTNIRLYSDDDLKHLLNVSLLNKRGYKISLIAKTPVEEINRLVEQLETQETDVDDSLSLLVAAMMELDESKFNCVLQSSILQKGVQQTFLDLMFPFMRKVGILWTSGAVNPLHEHFISNLIRQKLIVAIDGQVASNDKNVAKCILFLPEFENHELGLLFGAYLLKCNGFHVIYLGSHVPIKDIESAISSCKPDVLYCCKTIPDPDRKFKSQWSALVKKYPSIQFWSSGAQFCNVSNEGTLNHTILNSLEDLQSAIDRIQINFV